MRKTTRTPIVHCPQCNHAFNAATNVDGIASPNPGDLSVCIGCGCALEFGQGYSLKALSAAELEQIRQEDPEAFATLQTTIERIKNKRAYRIYVD